MTTTNERDLYYGQRHLAVARRIHLLAQSEVGDLHLAVGALDFNLCDAGGIELVLQILTDVVVLDDQIADLILTGIPTRVPIFNYADAQSMGINFLSHSNLLLKPSRSHRW